MGWLAKTGRRWLDLVGIVVAFATIVGFALTSTYLLAWVAIGALVLLVVSFGLTARDEYNKRIASEAQPSGDHRPNDLISEGHKIAAMSAGRERERRWSEWRARSRARVEAVRGSQEARAFSRLGTAEPGEQRVAIERQVAYLEGLH
jgi:hypothetical protein